MPKASTAQSFKLKISARLIDSGHGTKRLCTIERVLSGNTYFIYRLLSLAGLSDIKYNKIKSRFDRYTDQFTLYFPDAVLTEPEQITLTKALSGNLLKLSVDNSSAGYLVFREVDKFNDYIMGSFDSSELDRYKVSNKDSYSEFGINLLRIE